MSETTAGTLRRAAKLMLERADSMDAEFQANTYWGWSSAEDPGDVYRRGVTSAMGGAAGELAAPWGPEANRAMARWLQLEAADYAVHGEGAAGHYAYALDVARTYLGEVSA